MVVCAACALCALLSPGIWSIGPIVVSVRSVKNPISGFVICWMLSFVAAEDSPETVARWVLPLKSLWAEWTLARRVVGLLLLGHIVVSALGVIGFPITMYDRVQCESEQHRGYEPSPFVTSAVRDPTVDLELSAAEDAYADAAVTTPWLRRAIPDEQDLLRHAHWATDRIVQTMEPLPADARILYHGGYECMILAYELYPRRVFLLPDEQAQICEDWMFGSEKESSIRWPARFAIPTIDLGQFLREHRITHDVALIGNAPLFGVSERMPGSDAECRSRRLR
jgi:hypothetical protein